MFLRRRAVAFLLSLGLTVQVAFSDPPVPADGGQVQTETAPALLRLRVLEGEGSIHTVGSRSNQPIVVTVTDESGKPVEGVSVSLRLPEDGPTGTFTNGMRTEIAVTGPDGHISLRGIQWARTAGQVQIRITASKGEARAGIFSTQYLTEPAGNTPRRAADQPKQAPSRVDAPSRSKWILLAALIGGAAAGGVAVAAKGGQPAGAAAPPASTQPTLSIGPPNISIGKP